MDGLYVASSTVLSRIAYIFNKKDFCDVVFNVGDQQHEGHKLLLSLASPVFAQHFKKVTTDEIITLSIPNTDPAIFYKVLKYIYTDDIDLDAVTEACRILTFAQNYQILSLQEKCQQYINECFPPERAVKMFERASVAELQMEGVREICMHTFANATKAIFESASFLEAQLSTVEVIIKMDNLSVDCEMDILHAILNWGKAQCQTNDLPIDINLRASVGPLLKHIRFLTIPLLELNNFWKIYSNFMTSEEVFALTITSVNPGYGIEIPKTLCSLNQARSFPDSHKVESQETCSIDHNPKPCHSTAMEVSGETLIKKLNICSPPQAAVPVKSRSLPQSQETFNFGCNSTAINVLVETPKKLNICSPPQAVDTVRAKSLPQSQETFNFDCNSTAIKVLLETPKELNICSPPQAVDTVSAKSRPESQETCNIGCNPKPCNSASVKVLEGTHMKVLNTSSSPQVVDEVKSKRISTEPNLMNPLLSKENCTPLTSAKPVSYFEYSAVTRKQSEFEIALSKNVKSSIESSFTSEEASSSLAYSLNHSAQFNNVLRDAETTSMMSITQKSDSKSSIVKGTRTTVVPQRPLSDSESEEENDSSSESNVGEELSVNMCKAIDFEFDRRREIPQGGRPADIKSFVTFSVIQGFVKIIGIKMQLRNPSAGETCNIHIRVESNDKNFEQVDSKVASSSPFDVFFEKAVRLRANNKAKIVVNVEGLQLRHCSMCIRPRFTAHDERDNHYAIEIGGNQSIDSANIPVLVSGVLYSAH